MNTTHQLTPDCNSLYLIQVFWDFDSRNFQLSDKTKKQNKKISLKIHKLFIRKSNPSQKASENFQEISAELTTDTTVNTFY